MAIRISTAADDDGGVALRDLYGWLRQDPDVRNHADLSLEAAQQSPGTMGALDVVNMVLGQGFSALNLALSYAAWRAARPTAPAITLTVNGVSITVRDGSEETVRRIVRELSTDDPAGSA
ncbi:effector-associated constant component EACC1 [Streptomyces sp. S186]|uniref:effector-associated constant component EACC1 n=1 Tax=Streptomyces sp. S186 TaxID=3434395 RepID=UPI003F6633CC